MFPCHKGNEASTNKSHEYFFSWNIMNSCYMISAKKGSSLCFERNKESPLFHTNDNTIIVWCFTFIYFPTVNIEFSLFISKGLFSRDLVSYLCVYFLFTLKLFSLIHFNEIYFLEWSRYLFSDPYVVRVRWPWRLTELFLHYTMYFFSITAHFLNIMVHFFNNAAHFSNKTAPFLI